MIKLFLTEKVGFEPTAPYGVTGFQDRLLKPLGHLSKQRSISISSYFLTVKSQIYFFSKNLLTYSIQ